MPGAAASAARRCRARAARARWIPAASIRRRPGTPLALPRRSSSSRRVELGGVGRDDHLAAALVGDAALLAVVVHLACALHAQARLERAGRVVDARVDHARVVAGLMRADLGSRSSTQTDARGLRGAARARPPAPRSRRRRPRGRSARAQLRLRGSVRRHRRQAIAAVTAPGPPGAVAAAALTRPAPYRRSSPPPPSLVAVAFSRAVICAGVGWGRARRWR
jgi:hypothetical protein